MPLTVALPRSGGHLLPLRAGKRSPPQPVSPPFVPVSTWQISSALPIFSPSTAPWRRWIAYPRFTDLPSYDRDGPHPRTRPIGLPAGRAASGRRDDLCGPCHGVEPPGPAPDEGPLECPRALSFNAPASPRSSGGTPQRRRGPL